MNKIVGLSLAVWFCVLLSLKEVTSHGGDHAFAKIGIYQVTLALTDDAYVEVYPTVLGSKNQNSEWVTVSISNLSPSIDDWIGVFSPANFSDATCFPENSRFSPPYLCSAPIKYQYANYTNPNYKVTGEASLKLQLINQRSDFAFALFTGGLSTPTLVAVSNTVTFVNPNAPSYPRLAQGKAWDQMTVTWTSGYGINEAEPLVEWGQRGQEQIHSSAGTLTFDRHSMCGAPARTVGWRDPGYIHTSFLKDLWPNQVYTYKLGHKLLNGSIIWSKTYQFKSSPYPGQDSLQRVIIFGDMGKDEADGSNEYNNFQPGSLNTTKQLIQDLENIDIVFHIGDICYANGYLSQWDQFTSQIEPVASTVPYMVASGNHERDWPNSGSFYGNNDSGGECGVVAQTMFYVPNDNRDKFWYSTDYGMFRFCIADSEHDWREGTEQYKFIEQCFASVDRQKQPWLIFIAHRVLGYSSSLFYAVEGSFGEPMGRDSLQKLWQKYKVDIAVYGHAHNYERTCPVYEGGMTKAAGLSFVVGFCVLLSLKEVASHGDHAFAKIGIYQVTFALTDTAYVKASPTVLGSKNQSSEWVTVSISNLNPSIDDWIGVFSPANFSDSKCFPENPSFSPPYLCSAPIKYQYANYTNPDYKVTGEASLKLQLINQRSDFSFALFTGGLSAPTLVAVSNAVTFANPNAPSYPRLAQGKMWDEMTITWTSGYGINEAQPLVEWGQRGGEQKHTSAGTLTFDRHSMCGAPARTVGWRDPGYIHTSFLKDLWPNQVYTYKVGNKLLNGTIIWSMMYQFKSSPYPGQDSLQRVIIFGDMGKDEADGSNEYNNFQPGSLNTTKQLIEDLDNYDIVFHIGDICYANGYLSQWDQFTAQIEPIASAVPYMIASGNHERDWPNSGSFYGNTDSGGECGVVAHTMFYAPTDNRDKLWYSTDYGMFRFCIADTEHDWREGTEQYKFIEQCLASVDRQKQPWLIFIAHRVLGYSSALFYAVEGSFGEPMGRDSLQKLWQKYKVDIAVYGHVHNYERTCPVYENICVNEEKDHYKGSLNGTIHVVAGGAGADLAPFVPFETTWSIFRDYDHGFLKLTAYNHSTLLFEYKKSSDGKVYDSFTITRDYRDILACTIDSCSSTTLAS